MSVLRRLLDDLAVPAALCIIIAAMVAAVVQMHRIRQETEKAKCEMYKALGSLERMMKE